MRETRATATLSDRRRVLSVDRRLSGFRAGESQVLEAGRRIVLVAAFVGGFAVWRVIRGDLPSEAEKAAQMADSRPRSCPSWRTCRSSTSWTRPGAPSSHPRGDFFDGDPEDCGGSSGRAVQFDDVARADHNLIKAALAESGTPIERVGGTFLRDGRVRWAFFMSTQGAPFATSWSLEYDAESTRSPGPAECDAHAGRGRANWWFACCAD